MNISPAGLTHPAHWRPLARATLLAAIALLCAASGLLLYTEERSALRQAADSQRSQLQGQLKAALRSSAGLPALRRQEGELVMRLAAAEEQVWPRTGDTSALLQAKLARRAEECGLALESFRPRATAATAAAPGMNNIPDPPGKPAGADISLSGNYAQLLRFVELITAAPMAVMIDAMDISRIERNGGAILLMTATVTLPAPPDHNEGKP
ncbi:type 4a pilus biogenesis protein PilO [Herbaspirillum sp. LeCh32-8]|uniref:type 4a pilus biogenesis protein PilO n=1 Tax=Herbaspirillum sp. LeCh32-8 TaxID=2821356 RepID=UPI001AE757EC|nr:type 4a pilus biogenesis protein PilO [Herbaspirillum sp. LeCh32-8]MBP0600100.1 type 4a pilus biogenesis protein PilO [Herbaspirillum sp. LeCh32-8]